MLQEWAAIAQIIGVTMQGIDFAKSRTKPDKSSMRDYFNAMQALMGIKHPLVAWKQLHMGYSALRPCFERLYNELSNPDGTPKRVEDILPRNLQDILNTPTIYNSLFNIDQSVGVAIATLSQIQSVREATEEDYLALAKKGGKMSTFTFTLRRLNTALDNALIQHHSFVEFSKKARSYVSKDSWDAGDVRFFHNNRMLFYNIVNSMLTQTDAALMTLLEINVAIVDDIERIGRE